MYQQAWFYFSLKHVKTKSHPKETDVAGRWRPLWWLWSWCAEPEPSKPTHPLSFQSYSIILPNWDLSQSLCGGSSMYILKTAHCSVFIREKILLSAFLMSLFCVKIAYSCYLTSQCQTRTLSWNHWKTNYLEVCICPGEWRWIFVCFWLQGLDHKSIQLPAVSWGKGSGLGATGNLCPGFSWVVTEAVPPLPRHGRGRPRGGQSAWPLEWDRSAT